MSLRELKQTVHSSLVQLTQDHTSPEVYRDILQIVYQHNKTISKNVKGYWLDINLLSENCVIDLNNYLNKIEKA